MIALERPRKPRQMENTIALINIVFLMLVFFLIAGTIAPPVSRDIKAVSTTAEAKQEPPEGTLGVKVDGSLVFNGEVVTLETFAQSVAAQPKEPSSPAIIRLLPDRNLPATTLLDVINHLHDVAGGDIFIMSEHVQP